MAYYTARIKNLQNMSKPKRTSAGRGTIGVNAEVYLDTHSISTVGIEMWLRDVDGEPKLQVSTIGNGYDVNRNGEMLFDGTIEEFVELLKYA